MTYFTFDTAYIVAHLQNDANEALKERIAGRLTEMIHFRDEDTRRAFINFETFCWAWQNDCLADGEDVHMRPAVNCWPYRR